MESRAGGLGVVRGFRVLVWVAVLAAQAWGEDPAAEKTVPVLYGDGGGRIWSWNGSKTYLTPAGESCTLGGMLGKRLWGWRTDSAGRARFFWLNLPTKKGAAAGTPVFDKTVFPVPDLADRVDDRLLLVYGSPTGTRWEVWTKGTLVSAKAYEDRTIYAAALGPKDGWVVSGATKTGMPWLDVSGVDVDGPEGWRGRLTVAVWFGDDKTPYTPFAAGWGSSGKPPQVLFWEPSGWTQPAPEPASSDSPKPALSPMPSPSPEPDAAVYPVVGLIGKSGLTLGGWQVQGGVSRPWFWSGKAEVSVSSADGEIQALSLGKGKSLVVKHRSPPWFTFEDGKTSQPVDLDEGDRVVAVDAGKPD